MNIEEKYDFLRNEIISIKKEGTRVSDDARKALIHDISEKSKDERLKALGLAVTVMTVIVSLIAYIGFESVKKAAAEYIMDSELKASIVKDLSREREISERALNDAQNLILRLKSKERELDERAYNLIERIEAKEKSLVRVTNVIAKLGISNKDVATVIEPELLHVLHDSKIFNFTNSFGLSEISVIKLLASDTENFNFHQITQSSLSESIKQIQQRYDLTVDGQLGPCTSLVIGGLLLERFEMETRKEIRASEYKSKLWLVDSFQACSRYDKNQIQRYLDYPDLPLHSELNAFITAVNLDRNKLFKSLTNLQPNASAYKALSKIGYELPR